MKKVLEKWGTFDIAKNHFLTDKDANCEAIRKAIWDLFIHTDSYELALFYFSGHGLKDGYENGYIAPHDMIHDEPFVKGIDMGELRKIIINSKHEYVLMIFDCCYSGIAAKGESARGLKVENPFNKFFGDLGKSRFIMASSEEDKKSNEKPGLKLEHEDKACYHGIFTFRLLEGLYGYGKAEESGKITLLSLANYVENKMKETKQKSDLWFNHGRTLGNFEIGVVPQIRNDFIKKYLDEANKYLRKDKKKPDIMNSISLCKSIQQVLKIVPKNSNALKIKNGIDNKLESYKKEANKWLTLNEREIKITLQLDYFWDKIKSEWKCFDYDRILKIADDKKEEALLASLWKVSTGLLDMPDFIEKIKVLVQPQ